MNRSEGYYARKGIKVVIGFVSVIAVCVAAVVGAGCVLPVYPIETIFAIERAVGIQYCVVNGGLYALAVLCLAGIGSLGMMFLIAVGRANSSGNKG